MIHQSWQCICMRVWHDQASSSFKNPTLDHLCLDAFLQSVHEIMRASRIYYRSHLAAPELGSTPCSGTLGAPVRPGISAESSA